MYKKWKLSSIKLRSVGTKIFLLFFISIVLIVTSLGSVSYTISRNVVTDKYTHSTEQTIMQASQKINLLFGLYQALNLQITGNPRTKTDIGQFLENRLSPGELITILNRVKAELINARLTLPGIHSISLISVEDGTILYDGGNNPSFNPATDLHQQKWLKQVVLADGESLWLETKADAYVIDAEEPVFAVARLQPNYYANNQKSVICVIEISASLLTDSLKDVDIGENGTTIITGANNNIVYAGDPTKIGQMSPLVISEEEASFHVIQDNEELLVIHSPLEKSGWEVMGYVPLSVILEETNIIAQVTLIIAAIALLIAGAKSFTVIANQIRALADQSNQSIKVIGEVTDTIQRDVEKTVAALSKAYPIFQEQTQSFQETAVIFQMVEEHMNGFHTQMSSVINATDRLQEAQAVLDETMHSVSAVSQQTSASTEEVTALGVEQLHVSQRLVHLSEGLEQLSQSLQQSLTQFKLES